MTRTVVLVALVVGAWAVVRRGAVARSTREVWAEAAAPPDLR